MTQNITDLEHSVFGHTFLVFFFSSKSELNAICKIIKSRILHLLGLVFEIDAQKE